ncbi:MAG: hypothetical protein J6T39_00655, partial [Clostridia bacterium]|nr:hypothetical protein [Clostridia bacterium]
NMVVGRKWRGIYQITSLVLMIAFYLLEIAIFGAIRSYYLPTILFQILEGFAIVIWLGDVIMIAMNRYKVPVYKPEFSKKQK